ncbi:MAG: acyl-CoA oxidase [Myxococcales bacterium]|nr:acyl-CoA oxidase [Myxococcales bacterium]
MTDATPHTSSGPIHWREEPRLLPFMPMLYVAWADGDLADHEISSISERMGDGLSEEHRAALSSWLDPKHPPTNTQLMGLLREIREATARLPELDEQSLVNLGLEIARLNTNPGEEPWPNVADLRALQDLEEALGVVGEETLADIMPRREKMPVEAMDEPDPTFDVAAMTAMLDAPYGEIRSKVRGTIQGPMFTRDFELNKEQQREQVLEWCQELARRGFGAIAYPGVTCDADQDLGQFIAVFETLGAFDLSLVVKFGVQFGLFGGSVYALGTKKHHDAWLPQVASLELPGCFAMTELGHGSNVRDIETVTRYLPETDEFEVHSPTESSGKVWIGNAATHGRIATVFTQLEVGGEQHGVHAILVPLRSEDGKLLPGVRIEDCGHKMGLNGVDNGMIWFDRVRVPRDNLLDRFGQVTDAGEYESEIVSPSRRFFTMLGTLVAGRVSVASAAMTAAKVGLVIAVRYGARRRQFGPPGKPEVRLLNYRAHQRKLMPLLARTYAMDFALRHLTERFLGRTDEDEREVEALAAALKAHSTRHTTNTLQVCREACGGQGYLSDNLIGLYKADTDVFTTFEGDNTVLLQLVAKSLLTVWRQQFMDNKVFGVLKHLADRAGTALTERNPLITRQTDPAHLRDPEFHRAVLAARQDDLLNSAAQRIKRRIDAKVDVFEAFNDVQDHLISLAEAYAERVVFDAFHKGVRDCDNPGLQAALTPVLALHGLTTLESDIGWFLENGYFDPAKAKAIRTEVNALCAEVRQQAVPLVEGFGIPEGCVDVPIN